MHADRDSAAVVSHGRRAVCFKCYVNGVAVARKMLVHRIVYNFINQMIQAFPRGTSDIHTRALTHCFETFQHGNTAGIIRFFFGITVLSSLMCYCLFLLKILLSVPFWGTVFYYIIFLPGIARFSLEERISSVHQLLKRSHVAVCFLLHLCAVSFPASVIHAHSRKSAHFGAADSR